MAAFERMNIVQRQPRKNASYGWFGPYDANIVGGLLIGVGMASTGACPGTVLVQIATGVKSGIFVALGGLLGGIMYTGFGERLRRNRSPSLPREAERPHTVHAKLDLNPDHVLLAYEVLCLAVISASTVVGLDPSSPWLHPIFGGSLIGGAQAASLLFTGSPVGVSAAYEEAGKYFWRLSPSKRQQSPPPPLKAISFAAGILAGSFVLGQWLPTALDSSGVSSLGAVVGGCVMVFGARLAGGCTSGHGISGMSMFSISSIITVAAMFGGGIAYAKIVG